MAVVHEVLEPAWLMVPTGLEIDLPEQHHTPRPEQEHELAPDALAGGRWLARAFTAPAPAEAQRSA
ncbi:hypothetical protein ACIHCV_28725 [Streptomyces sp. NPDC051956]|uniref:hypothetical protein n=1 Tax=Streptomyces sp. NPDC051956 TaxID=3365677 RepID=UPI0037D77ABE